MATKTPTKKKQAKKIDFHKLEIDKQINLIDKALEPEVYPMLNSHGGGIEIMDIHGPQVFIRYSGACHGCPLASTGTLEFIEYALQNAIDKRIQVVPV